MAIKLTEEQIGLKDSIRRFLSDQCPLEYVKKRFLGAAHHDDAFIGKISELGLEGYFSDPGSGSCFRDLALTSFEIGYGLVPECVTDSLLGGVYLLAALLKAEDRAALDKLASRSLLTEMTEKNSRCCIVAPNVASSAKLTARGKGNPIRFEGSMRFVAGADIASYLVVNWENELYLCDLLRGKEQQFSPKPEICLDKTERRFACELKNVAGYKLSSLNPSTIYSLLSIIKANELAGAMTRAVEMTAEYVKTRKQFDVPVGGFQALQHKLADMHLNTEAAHALADFAAWAADESPDQLALSATAAITFAAEQAPLVIESAIQLHGGIGFTYEYDLHLFLRRAKTLQALYGPNEETYGKLIELAN